MKIIIIETRLNHYEVLGYFFHLKKRMPNLEVTIYAKNPNDTWLSFFKKEFVPVDVVNIDKINSESALDSIKADLVFINSIDANWDGTDKESIDFFVKHVSKSNNFKKVCLQLHMGSNVNANKFKNLDVKFISPFPNKDCTRLIMPYSVGINTETIKTKKLRLSVVGGIKKIKKETIQFLSKHFQITHFSLHAYKQEEGVKYFFNATTDFLVKQLRSDTDYILLDYPFSDRLSGIVLQAISLEIPLIINKEYADILDIPSDCYVTYETPDDIINNGQLTDNIFYYRLKCKIREYKESMIHKCDNIFLNINMNMNMNMNEVDMVTQSPIKTNKRELWRKSYFRNLWSSVLSNELRFKLSKGLFVGREAFIFAAGPSLSQVDMKGLKNQLNQSLVICIKQAAEVVGCECDAMMMNFCNYSNYDWAKVHCPVFWTTWNSSQPQLLRDKGAPGNAIFRVTDNGTPDANTLPMTTAGREKWTNFFKFPDGKVPWGPGLMYEMAIPLALHTGVSHIYLVGWDIGTINKNTSEEFLNDHFYDEKNIEMKTEITNLEIETVAGSTKSLRDWLASRGVGLSVISDRSLVDKSVKREMKWIKS
jgi:hypothetical protein